MAQVAGRFDENNMGSRKTTHGTMKMKSNVKGVPQVSTEYGGKPVYPMANRVEAGHLPKDNK